MKTKSLTDGLHQVRLCEAEYRGIHNYGKKEINKNTIDTFLYRFYIEGNEHLLKLDNGRMNKNGIPEYPLQNYLKEGYRYRIRISGDTVTGAEELPAAEISFTPVVSGIPGRRTVFNFLKTAMEPVGTTLYIYGGGWSWADVGACVQARSLGVSPDWVRFFRSQDAGFTYKEKDGLEENTDPCSSYYPYGEYNQYYFAGLDCSGFVGWALYNTLETESGREGYVMSASAMASHFAETGLGTCSQTIVNERGTYNLKPGDIMSIPGHVWISLGTCSDGSIVVLHSTPAFSRAGQPGGGVELSAVGKEKSCEAYLLADYYMSGYYPEWYERYPIRLADPETYLVFRELMHGKFSWHTDGRAGFTDPEGIQDMSAAQALKAIFT